MRVLALLLGFAAVQAAAVRSTEQLSENPIRRIVNLLQMMQKEIEADGEKDEEMTEKYICYCETNTKKLADSIAATEEEIPQIEASIKEAIGSEEQNNADLDKHKKDREDAKAAIDSATKQREKEAGSFDEESTESKANVAACKKAITAIEKGMSGSFLQSAAAGALRKLVLSRENIDQYTRRTLTEFLSTSSGYAPASGEIVGILKQLLEDMEKELADMTSEEDAAIAEFDAMTAAKEKEIQQATESIETKLERKGSLAVKIVNLKNDLADAQDALGEDQKFAAELKKGCATAQADYESRKKGRAEELVAVGETIKILNDDDALDLFKKTLPSPSLLQMTSDRDVRDEALEAFADLKESKHSAQIGLIQLALMGKKAGFEKIIKMIDDMVVLLQEEQKDDEKQKEWCEAEFDKSEDKEGELKRKIDGLEASIEEMKEGIAKLGDELKALSDGIVALDKSVAEATETRKDENAEATAVAAQNNAAVQLLGVAENRLNKFYNPAAYKPPQRRELTEEERIYVQSGGADPRDAEEAAAAQTGIAGTGVTVFNQAAPPPPPAVAGAYKKKSAGGPTALIQKLANELKMEIQKNEMEEKNAQEDYEELMKESAEKRAADSKTITEKEAQKAGLEGDLDQATKDHKAATTDLMALGEYIAQLHGSCDFLLENFDVRREARSGEIDAIKKAKAVLSGADYSFVQVNSFLQRKPHQHKAAHFRPPRSSGRHPFQFQLSPRVH
jgi:chromosome segregation ATPase